MKEKAITSPLVLSGVPSYVTRPGALWKPSAESRLLLIDNGRSRNNEGLEQMLRLVQNETGQGLSPDGTNGFTRIAGVDEASAGDIVIELADGDSSDAYKLEIGDYVRLQAAGERAVLYGLRTLLHRAGKDGGLARGILTDHPEMKERALHIDIGRKFFTAGWIKERIREMSRLRLNALQLHFSENEGFTLVSERHPEVTSERFLSREELADIVEEAAKHHITVIPSFDSPGHLGQALRTHPEWLLKNREGQPAKGALDITNPDAKAFVLDLIGEYAELFKDSPYFHIGGDEFIDFEHFDAYPQLGEYARNELQIEGGTGIDAYLHYLNEIAELLESKGFTVRAWNDGLYRLNQNERVRLKTSIQITYWTKWHPNMAPVQTFLDKGHDVINYHDAFFYYVLGENAGYKYPQGDNIYAGWHPGLFPRVNERERQEYAKPYPKQVKGCSFAVWSDKPEAQTEEEVAAGLREPLAAMAELAWTGEKRYGSFGELLAEMAPQR